MSKFSMHHVPLSSALLLACAPGLARAGVADTTLPVSATVANTCTVSTSPVNFGVIDTLTPATINAEGALIVTCTNGVQYSATADVGQGLNANFSERKMQPAIPNGDVLYYNLFTGSDRATLWGDFSGGQGSQPIQGTGTGSTQNITIYARTASAPAAENGKYSVGQYSDVVKVTLNY